MQRVWTRALSQALAAVEALNSSGLLGVGGVAMSLTESGRLGKASADLFVT